MAPTTPSKGTEPAPGSLTTSNTFPRQQTPESNKPRPRGSRANTLENGTTPRVTVVQELPPAKKEGEKKLDTFESETADDVMEAPRASVDMDEIPIELVSKTDNFIDSLSAKVHPTPPNVDNLSRLFQDFYHVAASHIRTHIDSLASRQTREKSPTPSSYSRASAASLLRAKAASFSNKEKPKETPTKEEQQMLTAEEFADRKRARKALEQKRILLEEAVERRLCEGIYDRIYRHRSTQDEAQDDKLRSKTAALALVGIGPADLGVDLGVLSEDTPEARAQQQEEIRQYLDQARKDLVLMHEKRYPLGKLNHLKAAHKSIVDTLSRFHPSSSADEIMPMLIYTLITMPPENLSVISDSNFIQRFRWEEKLEGESAYCLTNLEAAITFLQTVDLASLRADEASSGPAKLESQPGTPKTETFPPAYTAGLSSTASTSITATPETTRPLPPSSASLRAAVQRRRLSDLIQTPAQAIGTAGDSIFNTADQSFKTIGTSLGDSYKFLLGKLRDNSASGREVVVPRTLDDARKLIGTPPPEDDASVDGGNSGYRTEDPEHLVVGKEDKLLSLVGGKQVLRDRSADSTRSARSASSSKRVAFTEENKEKAGSAAATPSPSSSNPALVESMRNLGSSLNPMNRFAGMSMMRGFGRTATTPTPPAKDTAGKAPDVEDLATAFPDIAAALPPKDVPKIDPPKKKFIELQNPADLRLGDVLELLRDYRRLAGALKDMDAFKE
ncbi:alpha-actinin [Hypoxylon texense]